MTKEAIYLELYGPASNFHQSADENLVRILREFGSREPIRIEGLDKKLDIRDIDRLIGHGFAEIKDCVAGDKSAERTIYWMTPLGCHVYHYVEEANEWAMTPDRPEQPEKIFWDHLAAYKQPSGFYEVRSNVLSIGGEGCKIGTIRPEGEDWEGPESWEGWLLDPKIGGFFSSDKPLGVLQLMHTAIKRKADETESD